MDGAVLGALVGDEGGAKEVGAALQLHAHLPAEIWDLLSQAHDPDVGAIRLPFIPEEKGGMQSDRPENDQNAPSAEAG